MRLTILSSGSGGNCALVEGGGARVLVDAGLPLKVTRERARAAGKLDSLAAIDALLVTHEHSDHGGCAGVLARKLGFPVWATRGTHSSLRDPIESQQRIDVESSRWLRVGESDLWARAVPLPHDAAEPVAWTFEERGEAGIVRAAIVTDLGHVPETLATALGLLDLLVLEFNHDLRMLLEGPYPWPLKRRVSGDLGHLSNAQAAKLLQDLCHPGLAHVVLAHLSEHNNTQTLARMAAENILARKKSGARLHIGSVQRPLGSIFVSPNPMPFPRWAASQLALL